MENNGSVLLYSKISGLDSQFLFGGCSIPANTLRKSNVILRLYFGNLCELLSANVDVMYKKSQRCNYVGSAYVKSVT